MKKTLLKLFAVSGMLVAMSATVNAQWTHSATNTILDNANDRVGIGISSPTTKVDIYQATGACSFRVKSGDNSSNCILDRFNSAKNSLVNYRTAGTTLWFTGCTGNNAYQIQNSASVPVLYIDDVTNNVGIKTPTPAYPLDVTGSGRFTSTLKVGAYTLPATDGTAGQALTTNGAGTVAWNTISGGGGGGWSLTGNAGTNASTNFIGTTDNVGFKIRTNNTDRVSVAASGNVGIGTTAPNAPLQFANTLANRKMVLWETANNDQQYFGMGINAATLRYQVANTTDDHAFFAGTSTTVSNELMRIKGNGNVGIGTSSPTNKLSVAGNVDFSGSIGIGTSTSRIYTTNSGKDLTIYAATSLSAGGAGNLLLQPFNGVGVYTGYVGIGTTTPTNTLSVFGNADFSGNVGIGTATPKSKVEIRNDAVSALGPILSISNYGGGGGASSAIDFYTYSPGNNQAGARISASDDNNFSANIVFSTKTMGSASNSLVERVRITDLGNVGLGTSTPAYKLDVCGTIRGKEVRVETGWCDYVFANDYKLPGLSDVEAYIKANKHLPDVTAANIIETEGLEVGKVSAQMIKKIEELTLYAIEQAKTIKEQTSRMNDLQTKNIELEAKINSLVEKGGK